LEGADLLSPVSSEVGGSRSSSLMICDGRRRLIESSATAWLKAAMDLSTIARSNEEAFTPGEEEDGGEEPES